MAKATEERLSAAQRSKIRRLTNPQDVSPDEEEGGELNIVPFLDIVMNVLMFVLATITVSFTATMETAPPKAGGGGRQANTPTLGLAVLVVGDGFSVKARGGNIAPGCSNEGGVGAGLAVPKKNGDYDYDGLKLCAKNLKNAAPEFQEETQVTISANPNIPFQVIASTVDALRTAPSPNGGKEDPLFPDFNFGLAR